MIALVLGGSIWGYFKFVQNRSLVQAGHNQNVDKGHNREAELSYAHKLRDTHFAVMNRIRSDLQQFFTEVITKKKYNGDNSGFDQRWGELVAELRDHVEEFDQLMVPQVINAAHTKISHSHKTFYEALILLKQGFYAEKDQQKGIYKQSLDTFRAGWKEDLEGESQAHSVLEAGLI